MLSCLFIVAFWSPAGKGLTSWLSCMWSFLCFCHFPMWCPGSGVVFDCIDSIPELCLLTFCEQFPAHLALYKVAVLAPCPPPPNSPLSMSMNVSNHIEQVLKYGLRMESECFFKIWSHMWRWYRCAFIIWTTTINGNGLPIMCTRMTCVLIIASILLKQCVAVALAGNVQREHTSES